MNNLSPAATYESKERINRLRTNIASTEKARAGHLKTAEHMRIAADYLLSCAKDREETAARQARMISGWNAMLADEGVEP